MFTHALSPPAPEKRATTLSTQTPNHHLATNRLLGYVGVRQDMRGTGDSEGTFGIWHDSVNDSFDTLDWVTNQTWSNGEVFVTGASADAIDAVCAMSAPHPAIRAQVIVFATSQAWETFFVGGSYREALIDGWLRGTVPDQASTLIPLVHAKEAPSDPWWTTVNGTKWFPNIKYPCKYATPPSPFRTHIQP